MNNIKKLNNGQKMNNRKNNTERGNTEHGSIKTLTIVVVSVVLLLVILIVVIRINFMIGEQLRMTITPEYSEITASGQGNVSLNFSIKLYNKFICSAACVYTLTDVSHDVLLGNGSFSSKAYANKQYSFAVPMNYYGYGTNIYLYRVECNNVETTFCSNNGDSLVRKSLFVVKYGPSAVQLSALESIKDDYASISYDLANASILLAEENNIIKSINLSFDTGGYDAVKSALDSSNSYIRQLLSIWSSDDYVSAKSFMTNNDVAGKSSSILSNASAYMSYLNSTIENSNVLLGEFIAVESTLQEYRELLSHNLSYINSSTRKTVIETIDDVNVLIAQFNSRNYTHDVLYHDVITSRAAVSGLGDILTKNVASTLSDYHPAIYVYSNMLCMLNTTVNAAIDKNTTINNSMQNNSIQNNSIQNISIPNTDYFCSYDYSPDTGNIDDASAALNTACDRSSKILDVIGVIDAIGAMNNSSGPAHGNNSKETLLMEYKLLLDYESAYDNTTTGKGVEKSVALASYKMNIRNSLKNVYGIDDPETLLSDYTFNKSLLTFNADDIILSGIQSIANSCYMNSSTTISMPAQLARIQVQYYTLPITADNTDISLNLPNPPVAVPKCCMYGVCQSCENKTQKHPLILLHGHSFNQNTHAYQSIEIFNSFEQAFTGDKLYYATGMLLNNGNTTQEILGHYDIPFVTRPTYYLETYNDLLGLTVSESKTGNIDTYALRLKESIDYAKYISGSDKVDIVAHSMGGLVVRRYMQVFGTQSLGTVILIATPNNGISDSTYNLCKIFGASNECDDMRADGLFIKKINDYSNQPDMTNVYLVVGKGCDTDGSDGDGVISVNSSLIRDFPENRTLYVEGNCSGTTLLHGELLNVDEYPEVYDFVKSKLG